MDFEIVLPAITALTGVIIGGVLTYFTQLLLFQKQIKREKERQKEEVQIETMNIYSKFLDVRANLQLIERVNSNVTELNIEAYEKYIRPIFMEKIYLLHFDVSQKILSINKQLEISGYNEEITEEEKKWIFKEYMELEYLIFSHLNNYRKKHNLFN